MNKHLDLESHPLVAIWETNANFGPVRDPANSSSGDAPELSDQEAEEMLRDIAELRPPIFVFTGTDPLRRKNINSLVQYAAACNLHPTMLLTPASSVSRKAIADLKSAQLSRLTVTLQGPSEESHDQLTGVPGSFMRTLQIIQWANELRLPVQVRTQLSRRNVRHLEEMAAVLKRFRVLGWSLDFPLHCPDQEGCGILCAAEFEQAFARIYQVSRKVPFKVKTGEAQHYRRFVVQRSIRLDRAGLTLLPPAHGGIPGILPVNEARGTLFISSTGEIYPSESLRVSAGNIRRRNIAEVYRASRLFTSLRDTSNLKGKCGRCEFKEMCGGSRARAWAITGDMFSEEYACSYQPAMARKTG
ncbi:MAG TPA: radical SAM protein [Candidatus Limnocylindrales bacterium]|nr:radical SAM protein [Candidatus Limnocylindrales bacterium]